MANPNATPQPATPPTATAAPLSDAKRRLLELMLAERQAARARQAEAAEAFPRADREQPLVLSFQQERLWFLAELEPGIPAYNVPAAVYLVGKLEPRLLARAWWQTLERHEGVRTTFHKSPTGEAYGRILPPTRLPMPVIDLSALPLADGEEQAQRLMPKMASRTFDFEREPAVALSLLRLSAEAHVLQLVIHHIVSDVWSIGVLFRDIGAHYDALALGRPPALAPMPLQYPDYALWLRQRFEGGGEMERQLSYWLGELAGAPPVLELPLDFPRPPVQTFRGQRSPMRFGAGIQRRLAALAQREEASVYMAVLAAFFVLLHRTTGERDLLVGTPSANRDRVELEQLVGFFVNTVVLRGRVQAELSFRQLLRQVRETCLQAFAHHDLPFDRLVHALKLPRDLSRNPLTQIDFAFQNLPTVELTTPGLALKPFSLRETASRFDLEFDLREVGDGFDGFMRYNVALFEPATIERLARHYGQLLERVAAEPDLPLARLSLLAEAEEAELRALAVGPALPGTLAAASLGAVIATAARRASTEPAAFGPAGESWSWQELLEAASRVAAHLAAHGVGAEARVGLAAGRTLPMLAGLLGTLEAGAAYVPLDPRYPEARLTLVLEDAGVRFVLADRAAAAALPFLAHEGRQVLVLEELLSSPASAAAPSGPVSPDNAAYVLYTSGSTGRPKGVVVSHANVLAYLEATRAAYGLEAGNGSLVHSSLAFDLTVTSLLAPLAAGRPVRLVADGEGIAPLADTVQAATDLTLLKLTPAHLDALAELLPPAALAGRVRCFVVGGEALGWETVARAQALAPGVRVINEYGPTETTVGCSIEEVSVLGASAELLGVSVPIGAPIAGARLTVVDADGNLAPVGVPGELWIAGAGVARGYLGRPALTAARFVPDPWGPAGARAYRSGDRVRRLTDGRLSFLGRTDHQVKVRGFRIELGEIEAALTSHPAVQAGVVLVRQDVPGAPALVAYAVSSDPALDAAALRAHLAGRLPDAMVPAWVVLLPELRLTVNGKVDRAALPRPSGPEVAAGAVAPRTPIETALAEIWAEVLKLERVGVHDRFFDLGGQSMLAVQVVSRVRQTLQVELPVQALFNETTVASLATLVEQAAGRATRQEAPPILPLPRGGTFPLSFAQERLWFIDQLFPGLAVYNIPGAVRMRGKLDRAALVEALDGILARHEVLRTTFALEEGVPVQVIAPAQEIALEALDLTELPAEARYPRAVELALERVRRPFDLARGPLLRASLITLDDADALLVLVFHHIVYDMWSRDVFLAELVALYEAAAAGRPAALPPLAVQYADFAVWQRLWLTGEELERQLGYWRAKLEGLEPFELPTDRPRPARLSLAGERVSRTFAPELSRDLKACARRERVTPFVLLLSAFYELLRRYTGASDLAVGSPVANRNRTETEPLMGFFANTLVLRAGVAPAMTGRELLAQVSRLTLEAYDHQDLAFEKLVNEIQPERDLSRQPLFQVLFNFLINYQPPTLRLPELTLEPVTVHSGGTPFDFTFSLFEAEGRLSVNLDFATDLFDRSSMERMVRHFGRLLEELSAGPERALAALPMLVEAERQELLAVPAPALPLAELPLPVSRWFEAQVARTPAAPALAFGGVELSYRELDERANRLAHRLRRLGVGPEVVVGISLERSIEMAVAVLATLKAGGAYLPVDPAYPAERREFMLADAACPVVLTAETFPADLEGEPVQAPEVAVDAENLTYLIYTSGSTGRPKGAALPQRVLSHLIAWEHARLPAGGYRTLQFASLSFDVSFWEMFSTWATGGCLVLLRQDERDDVEALGRLLVRERIERAILPVVVLHQLAQLVDPRSLALVEVVSTGERLEVTDAMRAFFDANGARLRNDYGPSETHVVSSEALPADAATWADLPSIGAALPGARLLVLDPRLEPVPVGVPGQLWLGGIVLGRGYLGRPAQTAAAFRPDPYPTTPGARLYQTGDLARRLEDGRYEYLGRADHQVKIRGFRVEPGEVQTALARHPQLSAAAVVAAPGEGGLRLVAYLVPAGAERPDVSTLRTFLLESLPEFMVPTAWVWLEALPLSPNGKLDRRALPAPGSARPDQKAAFVAPRTTSEETVAAIWRQVLRLDRVGVHDNFFDLGGHSLYGASVIARVREAFRIELPLAQIFEQPTIAGLAAAVDRVLWATGGADATPVGVGEEVGEL